MFTGIIESTQSIRSVAGDGNLFSVTCALPDGWEFEVGESVNVNGVCSTVVSYDRNVFTVEYMHETLRRSVQGGLQAGDLVNLERALTLQDGLSGHIVQGHVDDTATLESVEHDGDAVVLTWKAQEGDGRYLIDKGSVTVHGISLTVIQPNASRFSVSLIPHTWEETNLHAVSVGDRVNIEYDVVAKYVENMVKYGAR